MKRPGRFDPAPPSDGDPSPDVDVPPPLQAEQINDAMTIEENRYFIDKLKWRKAVVAHRLPG